jgi:hypothetical protein
LAGIGIGKQISVRRYRAKHHWDDLQHPLPRSELPVTGIAQSGHDVTTLIQMIIDRG